MGSIFTILVEGVFNGVPSTNNALEAFNLSKKKDYTFGNRCPVGQFFEFVKCQMVYSWSVDRDPQYNNAKLFNKIPMYNFKEQTAAYKWIKSKKTAIVKKLENNIKLYYIPSGLNIISKDIVDNIISKQRSQEYTSLDELFSNERKYGIYL